MGRTMVKEEYRGMLIVAAIAVGILLTALRAPLSIVIATSIAVFAFTTKIESFETAITMTIAMCAGVFIAPFIGYKVVAVILSLGLLFGVIDASTD